MNAFEQPRLAGSGWFGGVHRTRRTIVWYDFWLIIGALLAGFILLVFVVAYDSRRINKGRH
jgi:hypothetical protein